MKARKQEVQIAKHMNKIVDHVKVHFAGTMRGDTAARVWGFQSTDKMMPAGSDIYCRCPDVVTCTDRSQFPDYRSLRTAMEVKSGPMSPVDIYTHCEDTAATIFRCQDSRRFVVVLLLHVYEMTVVMFDRGGSTMAESFSIIDQPELFVRIVLGFACSPLKILGYDPNIIMKQGERYVSTTLLSKVELLFTPFITDRIHSRGTVVQLGRLTLESTPADSGFLEDLYLHSGSPVMIKNLWQEVDSPLTEDTILALLAAKQVQGVPQLIAEEQVLAPGHQDDGVYDSTTFIRADIGLGSMIPVRPIEDAICNHPKCQATQISGYVDRQLLRLFTKPWGTPVTQFHSVLELLGVFQDYITSHRQAASNLFVTPDKKGKCRYFPFCFLHRDTSIANLAMVPQNLSTFQSDPKRTKESRGLLLDWGFSAIVPVNPTNSSSSFDAGSSDAMAPIDDPELIEDYSDGLDVGTAGGDEGSDAESIVSVVVTEHSATEHWDSSSKESLRSYIAIPDASQCKQSIPTVGKGFMENGGLHSFLDGLWMRLGSTQKILEVTGTRPFMAVQMHLPSLLSLPSGRPVTHDIHHDLEGYYLVLIAICVSFEAPHHPKRVPTSSDDAGPNVLPQWAVQWLIHDNYDKFFDIQTKHYRFATSSGLVGIYRDFSPYFQPLYAMLNMLREAIYGQSEFQLDAANKLVYTQTSRITHTTFSRILCDCMNNLPDDLRRYHEEPPNHYPPVQADGTWLGYESKFDFSKPPPHNNGAFQPMHNLASSETASRSTSVSMRPHASAATSEKHTQPKTSSVRRYLAKHRNKIYAPPKAKHLRKTTRAAKKAAERSRKIMNMRVNDTTDVLFG